MSTIDIIAHRGESMDAPENTLAAFNLAWERGAIGIEGDFHLNADGEIICQHDANTQRTTGVDLEISQATSARLAELDAGIFKGEQWRGERIPTLPQVLATLRPGKRLLLEIKDSPELVSVLPRDLHASGVTAEQVVIITFHEEIIPAVRAQLPELKVLLLTSVTAGADGRPSLPVEELIAKLRALDVQGVDCGGVDCLDAAYVDAVHAQGFEFHVWTVDDVDQARRMVEIGVDSITSNCADHLRRHL